MPFSMTLRRADGSVPNFEMLQLEAQRHGVTFTRSGDEGAFSGNGVKGTWVLRDGNFEITVTEKPWLLPEFALKSTIEKWFLSLPAD